MTSILICGCDQEKSRGFSLVEVMVVVAIVAILAALAVPNLNEMISEQRYRSAASDLAGDLVTARVEAIKRQRRVVVQAVAGGWLAGWTIFVDAGETFVDGNRDGIFNGGETFVDSNGDGNRNPNEILVKTTGGYATTTMRICGISGLVVNAGAFLTRVVFRGDGTVANAPIGVEDALRISDALHRSRDIRISPAGRVSVDVIGKADPNRDAEAACAF